LGLAVGVDLDDVGVGGLGDGLGLEAEAGQRLGAEGLVGGEDLQGHLAAERDLLGEVDLAHAALPELAEDAEVGDVAASGVDGWRRASRGGVGGSAGAHGRTLYRLRRRAVGVPRDPPSLYRTTPGYASTLTGRPAAVECLGHQRAGEQMPIIEAHGLTKTYRV